MMSAIAVCEPWPISTAGLTIQIVPSGERLVQAFTLLSPLSASQARCSAFRRPGDSPSMVVTDLPCTLDTGVRQENVRPPSMCTMQAPHCPAPQPYLVPVSLSSSRSTHRRGVPSGAALVTGLPLTVKVMAMGPPRIDAYILHRWHPAVQPNANARRWQRCVRLALR